MRTVILYTCSFCDFLSSDRQAVLEHECGKHYHITPDEHRRWCELTRKAEKAGHTVGMTKNPQTDKAFDDACRELTDFETAHKLTGKRPGIPSIGL